jgi:hypothetical protein
MTRYKADIFRELEAVLANADSRQIERLLSDIACGRFSETALTRAGDNDDTSNVTDINQKATRGEETKPAHRVAKVSNDELSGASRDERRQRYSS